jgi:hypothetical protein
VNQPTKIRAFALNTTSKFPYANRKTDTFEQKSAASERQI